METFDFEQVGVDGWTEEPMRHAPRKHDEQKLRFGHHAEYLLNNNIVDTIQSGTGIGKPALQAQAPAACSASTRRTFSTTTTRNHSSAATASASPMPPSSRRSSRCGGSEKEWNNPR